MRLGHYRVLYDDHFTSLLKAQLDENHTLISPLSRSQLLDDYFKCAYGGKPIRDFKYRRKLKQWLLV